MAGRFRTILAAYVIALGLKLAGKQSDKFVAVGSLAVVMLLKRAAPKEFLEKEAEMTAKIRELAASDK